MIDDNHSKCILSSLVRNAHEINLSKNCSTGQVADMLSHLDVHNGSNSSLSQDGSQHHSMGQRQSSAVMPISQSSELAFALTHRHSDSNLPVSILLTMSWVVSYPCFHNFKRTSSRMSKPWLTRLPLIRTWATFRYLASLLRMRWRIIGSLRHPLPHPLPSPTIIAPQLRHLLHH